MTPAGTAGMKSGKDLGTLILPVIYQKLYLPALVQTPSQSVSQLWLLKVYSYAPSTVAPSHTAEIYSHRSTACFK